MADVLIGYTFEATEIDFRLSRKMAIALHQAIHSHGNDAELNAFGRKLGDVLGLGQNVL